MAFVMRFVRAPLKGNGGRSRQRMVVGTAELVAHLGESRVQGGDPGQLPT